MQVSWQGVFPAATTQFNNDESLNIDGTLRHLDLMIENGIHGLVMLGTVGENCSLEYREKLELLEATVAHVAGRVPVLTGVAEYTTSGACRFANDAASAGVDGLMVLPAMVYNSDRRETVTHFRAVASACALPQMIYNNPVSYPSTCCPQHSRIWRIATTSSRSRNRAKIPAGLPISTICSMIDLFCSAASMTWLLNPYAWARQVGYRDW